MNDETPAKTPARVGRGPRRSPTTRCASRGRTATAAEPRPRTPRTRWRCPSGDDGATAASPPTEKGAWYESGLLPSTEVEGNLLECPADGQVKPASAAPSRRSARSATKPACPSRPSPRQDSAEVEHDALEKHLVLAYKALVHDDDASHRRNIVAYLAARCEVSHVANVVVNSSFVTLLLKLARRRDGDASLRRQLLVLLGLLVRHAAYVVPDAADDAALAPTLARVATDADADPATRCLALAALGELLFYVATQDDDDEDSFEQSDAWRVDPAHARCVVDHINHDHAELAAYACRTLENVLAQASAKRAAPFLQRPEAVAAALSRRVAGEPTPLARAALGALAQLLRASGASGSRRRPPCARPARASAARPPSRRPARTRCGTPTTRAGSSRTSCHVANSVLASDGGLACAEASGLAPALARALAGGRGLSAHARAKCAAALARICQLAPAAAAATEHGRDGGLVAALERVASRDAHELRADSHLEKCVRALAVGVAAAAVQSVKACAADALPLAARAAASPLLKGPSSRRPFLAMWGERCRGASTGTTRGSSPACRPCSTRSWRVAARCSCPSPTPARAPPRGLFVVALEALATFSQIGLDDDARADLARACAQLVRHTLPACRRSPAVQAVLADRLRARRRRSSGAARRRRRRRAPAVSSR